MPLPKKLKLAFITEPKVVTTDTKPAFRDRGRVDRTHRNGTSRSDAPTRMATSVEFEENRTSDFATSQHVTKRFRAIELKATGLESARGTLSGLRAGENYAFPGRNKL